MPTDYDQNVFINCPFDDGYRPLRDALIFVVFDCGFVPRCALEVYDAGEVRIEKIMRLIRTCRWGVHDLSRTELNARGLPRFNMPLELGLFPGAKGFGDKHQRRKSCLVLDRRRFRFQAFISDIAGQDVIAHGGRPDFAISAVRNWLAAARLRDAARIPGGVEITRRFRAFHRDLPRICAEIKIQRKEMTFADYADAVSRWLQAAESSLTTG